MYSPILLATYAATIVAQALAAQAIEEPDACVPAQLVGNEHMRWGYPGGECEVLITEFFVICHDNAHRVPMWVTYRLDSRNTAGDAERTDDFRPDPRLPDGVRAELSDYAGSGYDRGHMAPAAAFKRSAEAMSQTFVLSNMAPQTPSLNRQMWRMLEEDVRQLAGNASSIWVFTGSLFVDESGAILEPSTFIGENRVAVPTHFYKAILSVPTASEAADSSAATAPHLADDSHAAHAALLYAFVMPNQQEPLDGTPASYLVSVDLVETLSGLDFFSALPDSLEDRLESAVAREWPAGDGGAL